MKSYLLNFLNRLTNSSAGLALISAILVQTPTLIQAATFTPGNLVIYRTGDGVASLINTGNPVYLDEFTPAGTLVQSVALPTTLSGVQFPLIASGTASSEGMLTRSADGQYLILTGYGTTTGGTSLSSSTAVAVPRVIGRVAGSGAMDTSTALTNWASGNNPRSAASADGTSFWAGGGSGGVAYVASVGVSNCTQINTGINALANIRQVNIFGGQLYYSDSTGAGGNSNYLGAVGVGLPTTPGQNSTSVINTNQASSLYSYFFADLDVGVAGLDTLYVADDARGILKFSLVSGNWVVNCTNGLAADSYRGLTATVSDNTVTLYATRKGGAGANGGGELVSLVDSSGYNTAFTGTPTLLATAAIRTAFRGVALAPVGSTPSPTAAPAVITKSAPGQVAITFYGWSNTAYVVQSTTNILGPWVPFSTNEAQPVGTWNNGSWIVTDPDATNAQKYYRLIIKP